VTESRFWDKLAGSTISDSLAAIASKEDMHDDKEEGEETRAVLPSSHSWRAPTPIHWPLPPFGPVLSSPSGACVCIRACMRVHACLLRVSCLRALVFDGEGAGRSGRGRDRGDRARARARESAHVWHDVRACVAASVCACSRVEQVYAPHFFPSFWFRRFVSSLFTGPSFSLSKRRRVREQCIRR